METNQVAAPERAEGVPPPAPMLPRVVRGRDAAAPEILRLAGGAVPADPPSLGVVEGADVTVRGSLRELNPVASRRGPREASPRPALGAPAARVPMPRHQ
jgi:hypothetical protein